MATISENLQTLATAKANIKTAIENKGQDLTNVPFTQYGEKIEAIQAGIDEISIDLIKGLWMTAEAYDGMYEMLIINDNHTLSYRTATGNSSTSFEIDGCNIIVHENVFATYDTNTGLINITENDVTKAFYKQQEPLMSTVVGTYENNAIGLSMVLNADGTAKLSMAGQKFDCTFTINGYEIVVNATEDMNVTFEYISMTGQLVFWLDGVQWLDRVATRQPNLASKSVNQNGTYNASDDGLDGYSSIDVNVRIGTAKLDLKLPSEFMSGSDVYFAEVTRDKLLFNSNGSAGIWIYTISTSEWKQISSEHNNINSFQQVTDTKWLCGSDIAAIGVILYNAEDDSVTKIYGGNYYNCFDQLTETKWTISGDKGGCLLLLYNSENDSCIETGYGGFGADTHVKVSENLFLIWSNINTSSTHIVLIDTETDEITQPYTFGYYWNKHKQITETEWLITANNSKVSGLLLFNSEERSITNIYSSGYNWSYITQVTDTKYIIGGNGTGVLLYNTQEKTCTLIYDTGSYWNNMEQVTDKKWIIGASSSYGKGVLVYNTEDDSVTLVYGDSWYWNCLNALDNGKCLLSSTSSSVVGLYLYNAEDDSVTQIYSNNYGYKYVKKVTDTKYLIGSNQTNTGVLLYNAENDSCTKIYSRDYGWEYFAQASNTKCLIGSSYSNTGLLLYNAEDDSCTKIYSSYYLWAQYSQRVTDTKSLLTASNGLLLYNAEDDSVKYLAYSDVPFDTFILDINNNYYISASDKTQNARMLYYTENSDTIGVYGYYVEAG